MIDIGDETLISMAEAGHLLARRLKLKKAPHASSLWRWREKGQLDGLKVAGKIYTSVEAVDRFMNACRTSKKKTPTGRLSPVRERQIGKARLKCERARI